MRRIKVAQIGTSKNSHGNQIIRSLKKQSDIFEVAGVAFPENEKEKFPEQMADFAGLREMTVEEILGSSEIEAVVIETEEVYLTKYALLAAQAGKHIHMEKPGGINLADFEKLIDTVKKNQVVFHMGYMYRYNPFVNELMGKIKNGELGEIISVEAQMNCDHSAQTRQWFENFPGGIMFFLGCHLVDLILQIKGVPDRIIPLNKSTGVGIDSAEDFGMAVFEYKNGCSFVKVNATEKGGFARRQLVVSGTKGTVELKPFEMFADGGQFTTKTVYTSADWGNCGETVNSTVYDRYDGMMRSFAKAVCKDEENPYTYDYELQLYKTLLSATGHEPVTPVKQNFA